ncbi:hypothetical protein D9M72_617930 [compost metagenome]
MLLVDLQKLERRTGAIALELGALHIGIVDVALQPAAGGCLELALLDLLAKLAAAAVAANRGFRHALFPSWLPALAPRW